MSCTCSVPSTTAHAACSSVAAWVSVEDMLRSAQVYNGLCQCRGPLAPHPFHAESITTAGQIRVTLSPEARRALTEGYVGKHRKPE